MQLRAARQGDPHVCMQGHPENPIEEHSPNVRTGGELQARCLDACNCPGTFDNLKTGAQTVLVNGLPMGRDTDNTVHDGFVMGGFDRVKVGGPTVTIPLEMTGSSDFRKKVKAQIAVLLTTPTGKTIFQKLTEQGRTIKVTYLAEKDGGNSQDGDKITWDPDTPVRGIWHPVFSLGHELTHAIHNTGGGREEERRTAGTSPAYDTNGNRVTDSNGRGAGKYIKENGKLVEAPDYRNEYPSENSLRRDLNWPERNEYNARDPNNMNPADDW